MRPVAPTDLAAPTCHDLEDTSLIATAVGGRAHFLVTADPDLLDDPAPIADLMARGIQVLRAGEFLSQLE